MNMKNGNLRFAFLALCAFALVYVGCGTKSEAPPPSTTTGQSQPAAPATQAPGASTDAMKGQSAHAAPNADGVPAMTEKDGTPFVGWDELVKNGSTYNGRKIHVKALYGGSIIEEESETGFLFPVDMDREVLRALMEFTASQPGMGPSMPVRFIMDKKMSTKPNEMGTVYVMEGIVHLDKTGPGTGFMVQRGISQGSYLTLLHATIVKK